MKEVGKKDNWFVDTFKWLFDMKDWKMLFRSIPSMVVALFLVATVSMNLMANKFIVSYGSWVSITWGLVLSWLPFLCSDIITKTYGAKASIKLNIVALLTNLACTLVFLAIAVVPNWQYGFAVASGFEVGGVFRASWYVCLASSIAFIVSGILNSITNAAVGKLFKKNPDGKAAFVTRTYTSTLLGQFIDNFLFIFLAFGLFANIMNGFNADILLQNLGAGVGAGFVGALAELLMEAIFSPIGYRICKKWRNEGVGAEYLSYCKEMEQKKSTTRIPDEQI